MFNPLAVTYSYGETENRNGYGPCYKEQLFTIQSEQKPKALNFHSPKKGDEFVWESPTPEYWEHVAKVEDYYLNGDSKTTGYTR